MQVEEILVQAERIVRLGLTVLFTYLIALWFASIWWTMQDIHSRATNPFMRAAAALLVIVFNFPGLLIYFILRPRQTLTEAYVQSLGEEALLGSIGESSRCPSCDRQVQANYLFCPWCQTRLRQRCQRCERPIEAQWSFCPYCGISPSAPPIAPRPARELVKS